MDAADALDLIREYGRALTLRQRAAGSYDPATGITTPGAQTDTAVLGAQRAFEVQAVDGVTVRHGDQKVLVPAAGLSVIPDVGDQIVEGNAVKIVLGVRTFRDGSIVIAWDLHVRAQA